MPDLHLTLDRAAGHLSVQVATALRGAVRAGRLHRGARLPASRTLAADLGVSRGVVVSAYEQLVAEGFLVSRQGDGTRVADLAAAATVAAPGEGPGEAAAPAVRYDLRPGAPDLAAFPRERWLAALRRALREMPNAALDYPDPAGVAVLREALAEYLGRVRAATVGPDRVVVTAGVAQALVLTVRALLAEGHTTLALEDPTTHRQLPLLAATGIRLVRAAVDGAGIDVAALRATGARAVLVTPAHQFPTGVVLSPRRRAELLTWARAVDGTVVEDDYDAEFRYDREPVGCLQGLDPDRVVLTGSTSKTLAPGLRLGWLTAPDRLAARLRGLRAAADLGSPVVEQYALADFIAAGGYDRHLRLMRRAYRLRRDALAGALTAIPGLRVHGVSAGLHLYVELPDGVAEDAVVADLAARGVAVHGAAPMWAREQPAPALCLGYSRLTPDRLVQAAGLIGAAVRRPAVPSPPTGARPRPAPAPGRSPWPAG